MIKKNIKIAIIGLGYVGLPLAIEFGKKYNVIGYDKNKIRVNQLNKKIDLNGDIEKKEFIHSKKLLFSFNESSIEKCNIYIIAVPTPINKNKTPNLKYIDYACITISKYIKKNDIVILESTVYPGLTEDYVAPLIQKKSNLLFNIDFFCGYSPERINPNDKIHNLINITKITSGSTQRISKFVDNLYKSIIKAGTFNVKNIKIAEAAKVIENSQRDINIAFINELTLIFNRMKINTDEVLKAASTKWNFMNFKPGLVGGHCIGVDPYYLTYSSKKLGYLPKIISSGRAINDNYPKFIASEAIKKSKNIFNKKNLRFLIMGFAFKENCRDFRNSKSIDLYKILIKKNIKVDCYDSLINEEKINKNCNIKLIKNLKKNTYNCIIIAVAHNNFKKMGYKSIQNLLVKKGFIFDIKNIFKYNKRNLYL
tara:strand:- start:834 stop:2105 length:1272 start_codon:yes stop_codon:yes gene_type:complete